MRPELDARDHALLEQLVDEQIAGFRRLGYFLMVLLPVALAIALLEWNDARHLHPEGLYVPDTSAILLGVGLLSFVLGAALARKHRHARTHALYGLLVEHRLEVTRVEVIRVLGRTFDRIVVHSKRSQTPARLVVRHQDRDAVAALLARACPQLGDAPMAQGQAGESRD